MCRMVKLNQRKWRWRMERWMKRRGKYQFKLYSITLTLQHCFVKLLLLYNFCMYWKDYFFLKLFIDLHDFIADLYICITVKFL